MGVIQEFRLTGLEVVVLSRSSQRLDLGEHRGTEPKFRTSGPLIAAGQPHLLGVPLIVGDEVIGTMGFNRGSRPFSQKDLGKAEKLGSLVAGAFADFKLQEYKALAEREITKNRAILEAEANIGGILSAPLNRSGASEKLISEIANIVPLDVVVIAAVDVDAGIFTSDFDEFLYDPRLMIGDKYGKSYAGSITAEVVEHGEGRIINADDRQVLNGQLPRVQDVVNNGYRTMMGIPLVFEEKTIGALIFLSRREREYGDQDMVIAQRIGNLLAGALASFKIIVERNRAQSDLLDSDQRFRQIAESILGVFWLLELQPRRLIYASPNFEDVWDVPVSAVYEDIERWYDTIHPADRDDFQKVIERSSETGEHDVEYRTLGQNGSVQWIRTCGFPVRNSNGKLIRMSGISEDITEKRWSWKG